MLRVDTLLQGMGEPITAISEHPVAVGAGTVACAMFEEHRSRIYRQCFHMLRSPHDAEDALQQTFVNVLQALQAGVKPRFETAWVLTIARNVCLERQRNASRRARIETSTSPDNLERVPAPSDGQPVAETSSELRAALSGLDSRQRDALLLREWRGLSYKEIASALELSQAHVETLLFRARRSLAKTFEDGKRLRTGLSLASLLGNLRSLLAGSAAKTAAIAVGCGATVVSGAALDRALTHHSGAAGRTITTAAPRPAGISHAAPSESRLSKAGLGVVLDGDSVDHVQIGGEKAPGGAGPASPGSGETGASGAGSGIAPAGAPAAPAGGSAGSGSTGPSAPAGSDIAAAQVSAPPTVTVGVSGGPGGTSVSAGVDLGATGVAADSSVAVSDTGVSAQASVDAPAGTSVDASAGATATGVDASADGTTPAGDTSADVSVNDTGVDVSTTLPGGTTIGIGISFP